MKKEMVAMLLAGGQGSRLYALTSHVAKPAVPFGGKYRIIDFPLSNCVNSGIDTVGVLTQYQPLKLNSYLGNGQPWDLDRSDGGLHVLPPYVEKGDVGTWFKGTANAIYQNINFIDEYDPDYVLILSGDHIYKMDYAQMLEHHKQNNADATISVLEVSMEEATRFGIMNVDENDMIYEFEEKPAHPKSNLASMGIYIFTWAKLRKYLIEDEADPNSSNDFGKNIIPTMLANGERMSAYRFKGYWKDVGTIQSLWDANMDMLDVTNPNGINVYDKEWQIFARNPVRPPHVTGRHAVVHDSLVTDGCQIFGTVEHSVLFHSVTVEDGAVVRDSVIMPNTLIKAGAVVDHAIVAENAVIGMAAQVGVPTEDNNKNVVVVAEGVQLEPGAKVPYGAMCTESPKGGDAE
jgi:glucose-1-phosphate adenylyltransferase